MKPPNADPASLPNSVLEAALDVWGQVGEQHLIPITGRSMLPAIQDGDRVLVAHGCTGVQRGDVVVFRHAGGLVAHRVLRLYAGDAGPTFVTKGGNAPQCDPPLNAGEIVGRALAVERDGRRMSLDLDRKRLIETVRAEEAQVGVYYSLHFLDRLLGVSAPEEILTALRPDRFRRWAHERYLPEEKVLSLQPSG
jgi:hypothetical protein